MNPNRKLSDRRAKQETPKRKAVSPKRKLNDRRAKKETPKKKTMSPKRKLSDRRAKKETPKRTLSDWRAKKETPKRKTVPHAPQEFQRFIWKHTILCTMPLLLQISMVWIEAHYIIHNVTCHSIMFDYAQCHVCPKDVFFLVGSTLSYSQCDVCGRPHKLQAYMK